MHIAFHVGDYEYLCAAVRPPGTRRALFLSRSLFTFKAIFHMIDRRNLSRIAKICVRDFIYCIRFAKGHRKLRANINKVN